MTLRGAELLSIAEVVLYDGLCNPEILAHAPQAEQICVGKHGQSRIWRQTEIIDEMLAQARSGKAVARLKGGDPAVFARTAEEITALSDAKIPFEIVPGITAALAAGSYAGIPVTHRGLASAVALVTGHEEPDKCESALDWASLAKFPGTLVIYMGVTTAKTWTDHLISQGKPPSTPVAIIRRCSLSDQQTIRCSLGEIPDLLQERGKIRPPVIVIIGEVANLQMEPFQRTRSEQPLSGQCVLVTRPTQQANSLATPLRDLGANVLFQPMIKISPPDQWSEVDELIDNLSSWDYLIFCSQNGVRYFMNRVHERGFDSRCLFGVKLGVVGTKTGQALRDFHLEPDFIPDVFTAEALSMTLGDSAQGKRVAILRASRGKDEIANLLQQFGAQVKQVVTYQHEDVEEIDTSLLALAEAAKIDWVTVMSGESARNLYRTFGDRLSKMKIASISPLTSRVIEELGFNVVAEATPHTTSGLIDSMIKARK
ncbi:uroporphyrinogen-III C-methyltransferase [Rubripirellula sp.]|nr:uroporphyrinogen-III C-methyltransferase [Rubripirellula sp.]MDB4339130.1 uroporphyrinogen-III C-methyltransferase [Rubripirellula sp.]